jgi:hypothetical protein
MSPWFFMTVSKLKHLTWLFDSLPSEVGGPWSNHFHFFFEMTLLADTICFASTLVGLRTNLSSGLLPVRID